jgi:hypothetical protein
VSLSAIDELYDLIDRHAEPHDPTSWVWDALELCRVAREQYRELEDLVDPVDGVE